MGEFSPTRANIVIEKLRLCRKHSFAQRITRRESFSLNWVAHCVNATRSNPSQWNFNSNCTLVFRRRVQRWASPPSIAYTPSAFQKWWRADTFAFLCIYWWGTLPFCRLYVYTRFEYVEIYIVYAYPWLGCIPNLCKWPAVRDRICIESDDDNIFMFTINISQNTFSPMHEGCSRILGHNQFLAIYSIYTKLYSYDTQSLLNEGRIENRTAQSIFVKWFQYYR